MEQSGQYGHTRQRTQKVEILKFHVHRYVQVSQWESTPGIRTTIKRCKCRQSKITRTWIVGI